MSCDMAARVIVHQVQSSSPWISGTLADAADRCGAAVRMPVADAVDVKCHGLYGALLEERGLNVVCGYVQAEQVDEFLKSGRDPLSVPRTVIDAALAAEYPGAGDLNDVGCPKNQWVSGYYRADGTYVDGYFRNSPSDGCGGG
jgi:hypothetical protein